MIKLTKRQKYVVDQLNKGAVISVGVDYVTLSIGFENENLNTRLFWGMVIKKIVYQEQSSPFYWLLAKEYQAPKPN